MSVPVPRLLLSVLIAAQLAACSSGAAVAAPAPAAAPAGPAPVGGDLPRGVKLGRFHAVVIGNNSYRDAGYPTLQSAANDANAVAELLRHVAISKLN